MFVNNTWLKTTLEVFNKKKTIFTKLSTFINDLDNFEYDFKKLVSKK